MLIEADLVLAFVPGLWGLGVGVALWGLHMGFTQGLFNALIADRAPAELRDTAFGMFHLLTGVVLLLASVVAGVLWDVVGFQDTVRLRRPIRRADRSRAVATVPEI